MRARRKIHCVACQQTILDSDPDLILRDLKNGGRARYYHTGCGEAAHMAVMDRPSVYRLTVRHIEEGAN